MISSKPKRTSAASLFVRLPLSKHSSWETAAKSVQFETLGDALRIKFAIVSLLAHNLNQQTPTRTFVLLTPHENSAMTKSFFIYIQT